MQAKRKHLGEIQKRWGVCLRPVCITNKALKDCSARIRIKGARFLQIIRDVIYVINIVIYHQVSVYHLCIHTFLASQKHSLD